MMKVKNRRGTRSVEGEKGKEKKGRKAKGNGGGRRGRGKHRKEVKCDAREERKGKVKGRHS